MESIIKFSYRRIFILRKQLNLEYTKVPGFQVLSVALALSTVPAIYKKKKNMREKAKEEEHNKK